MANEFDNIDSLDDTENTKDVTATKSTDVSNDFDNVPQGDTDSEELTPDDFESKQYIKINDETPSVTLTVIKVVNNKKTSGTKKTGETFTIGLVKKDKTVRRIELECEEGTFTITAWEVFYKLLGKEGVLNKYQKTHNKSYKGAKLKITRNFNGNYQSMPPKTLAKVLSTDTKKVTEAEAVQYQEKIAEAMKNKMLYSVELLN